MAAYNTKLPLTQLATQSLVFALGSTLLHSTACVINDICDIEFDRQVGTVLSLRAFSALAYFCPPCQNVQRVALWLLVYSGYPARGFYGVSVSRVVLPF